MISTFVSLGKIVSFGLNLIYQHNIHLFRYHNLHLFKNLQMSLHWPCLNRKIEYLFLNEHSLNNKIVIWPTTWWSASFYPSLISFTLICIFWVFCLLWICIHIDKTKSQSKCLLVYMYISCSLNLIREYYRLHVCIFLIVVLFLHGWEWLCDRVFCSAMLQIIVDNPLTDFSLRSVTGRMRMWEVWLALQ